MMVSDPQRSTAFSAHATAEPNWQLAESGHTAANASAARLISSQSELRTVLAGHQPLRKGRPESLLLEDGLIDQHQLALATARQEEHPESTVADILLELGLVPARELQRARARLAGVPEVDVSQFPLDDTVLMHLDSRLAIRHQVLPLLIDRGDRLVIATADPFADAILQTIRFVVGMNVVPVLADPLALRLRIPRAYTALRCALKPPPAPTKSPGTDIETIEPDLELIEFSDLTHRLAQETAQQIRNGRDGGAEENVSDSAMVQMVNKIIREAHSSGASDIHIECNPEPALTRIRFRRDGELEDYLDLQPAYRNALVSRIKIMAGLDISEHRHSQDGKIEFARYGGAPIELRVAIVPTANGLEDIVLRLLGGVEPIPIDKLGFGSRDLAEIKRMVERSNGLILVCGPTGSGKTTTLHSILRHINRPDLKIWTAEDPIEITQPGLRQVQINAKIGWTFAAAMRAFLRADPDVIMVGEMRDAETTKIGIEASLTGHLVFSTLHTNSAAESIVRLLELGMDPFNFADALIGILSQRLARRLCTHCKQAYEPSEPELLDLAREYCLGTAQTPDAAIADWRHRFPDGIRLHRAVGCKNCSGGYRGRMGVYELLTASPTVKHHVRSRGTVPDIVTAGLADGMRLLKQDAIDKALAGDLDLVSARVASS